MSEKLGGLTSGLAIHLAAQAASGGGFFGPGLGEQSLIDWMHIGRGHLNLMATFVRENALAPAEALFIHAGARGVHAGVEAGYLAASFADRLGLSVFAAVLKHVDAELAAEEARLLEEERQVKAAAAGPVLASALSADPEDTIYRENPDPLATFKDRVLVETNNAPSKPAAATPAGPAGETLASSGEAAADPGAEAVADGAPGPADEAVDPAAVAGAAQAASAAMAEGTEAPPVPPAPVVPDAGAAPAAVAVPDAANASEPVPAAPEDPGVVEQPAPNVTKATLAKLSKTSAAAVSGDADPAA